MAGQLARLRHLLVPGRLITEVGGVVSIVEDGSVIASIEDMTMEEVRRELALSLTISHRTFDGKAYEITEPHHSQASSQQQ